jgi:spore germination cell wall hydrolase CwlJ-like protein
LAIPRKGEKMIRLIKTVLILIGLALVIWIGVKAVKYKLDPDKEISIKMSAVTAEVRNKQLDCLAKNIYYEAGHEPFEGKVAIAQVTINRSESGQFPRDICQVVYQKNVVYDKVLCQFSWYCENASVIKPRNLAAYKESEIVARQVLLENFRLPSLTKALYFHGKQINPKWGREKVAVIGNHIFYK